MHELSRLSACRKKLASLPIEEIIDILSLLGKHLESKREHSALLARLPEITGFSREMCQSGLEVLSGILDRESLLSRVKGEFGHKEFLDGFYPESRTSLLQTAIPLGVILHVAPGNVFLGIADSIVMAFLTKNASLVKLSSRDTFFPLYFGRALEKIDKTGALSSCLGFIESSHDSEKLAQCCREADGILFWGGAEALRYYKQHAGEHTRLIANGPRFSVAVIEEKAMADGDYSGLARDISMWEQQACSSPQVIYLCGDEERFSSRLTKAIQDLLKSLPPGQMSFDEKVEIRRERESARIEAQDHNQVPLTGEHPDLTLIRLYNDGFRFSPGHRTVFVRRIKSASEVPGLVTPLKPFLQTAGIKLASGCAEMSESLAGIGVLRITPLGRMCEGVAGAPHDGRYVLQELCRLVTREQGQADLLQDILDHARTHSPHYRKIIRTDAVIEQVPLLDRETMQKISPPKSTKILTGPLTDGFYFCSGGTTGSPKYSFYTNEDFRVSTDILADIYRTAGITEQDRVANLFIAGNLWTSFLVANRALQNIGCVNLPIAGNTRTEDMADLLIRFQATAIVGLPTIIVGLAEQFRERKLKSPVRKVLYGGEHMNPEAVKFLKRHMAVTDVRSAGYAIVDSGPIGVQCTHLSGSLHHAISRYNHIEFIRDGVPVPDGEEGEIVVTNLSRRLMPVIRFRTGDLGRKVLMQPCPCGSKEFVFELLGRADDFLVIGGMNLHIADISRAVGRISGLSPIIQLVAGLRGARDHLLIRVETLGKIDFRKTEKQCLDAIRHEAANLFFALSKGLVQVEFEFLNQGQIERNARTGKIRLVIDKRRG
ncbi:MAG: acyl-CoA reductase [Candidatus Wallbacteria bacterium]|nr:acyl-CoA reductase [Candidatus Wallbacteria bacterium]